MKCAESTIGMVFAMPVVSLVPVVLVVPLVHVVSAIPVVPVVSVVPVVPLVHVVSAIQGRSHQNLSGQAELPLFQGRLLRTRAQ